MKKITDKQKIIIFLVITVVGFSAVLIFGTGYPWKKSKIPENKKVKLARPNLKEIYNSEDEVNEFQGKELRVNVSKFEPCVIKSGNKWTGFDIDLFNEICKELNYAPKYKEVKFKDIFKGLESKTTDVALAGITIRADREKKVDFSHQYIESKLEIVSLKQIGHISTLSLAWSYIVNLNNWGIFTLLLMSIVYTFLCGVAVYLLDLKSNKNIPNKFFDINPEKSGIDVSTRIVWEYKTTQGTGSKVPFSRLAWLLAAWVNFFIGAVMLGVVVSSINSTIEEHKKRQLECKYQDFSSLNKVKVATKRATTSVEVLRVVGAEIIETDHIDEAYEMLLNKEVEAVVFDKPNIRYFANNAGKDKVIVATQEYDKEYYGIALQEGSELRESINRVLLKFKENGVYDKIYKKWFGQIK